MIKHIVLLKSTSPLKAPDAAAESALERRLAEALARYCAGDAAAEDACRKWLAFERGILAEGRVAAGSLLALADAVAVVRPEERYLSSPAAAFLTFRLLGLSSLPPVRAGVPEEGLPPLLAPPEGSRWGCGLLPFRPKVRFRFRAGAPWARGLFETLDRATGDPSGGGWEIEFEESERAAGRGALPRGGTLADDAAAAPALFAKALALAEADDHARGAMFYEEATARLRRDLPGLPLRDAMRLAEKGRAWTRGKEGLDELVRLWCRHREVPSIGPMPPFGPFADWCAELREPMMLAWPLWYWATEAEAFRPE